MSEGDIEYLERGLAGLSEELSVTRTEYRVTFDFLLFDSDNQMFNLFGFGRSSAVYREGTIIEFVLRLPPSDPVVKQRIKDTPYPIIVHERPSNLRPTLHIKPYGGKASFIRNSYDVGEFISFVKRVCEIYEERTG